MTDTKPVKKAVINAANKTARTIVTTKAKADRSVIDAVLGGLRTIHTKYEVTAFGAAFKDELIALEMKEATAKQYGSYVTRIGKIVTMSDAKLTAHHGVASPEEAWSLVEAKAAETDSIQNLYKSLGIPKEEPETPAEAETSESGSGESGAEVVDLKAVTPTTVTAEGFAAHMIAQYGTLSEPSFTLQEVADAIYAHLGDALIKAAA